MPTALRRLAPFIAAAAVLSPLLHSPNHDSYPLSTYPMFADDRGPQTNIDTVVAIDPDGVVHRLTPKIISGTDEIVTASEVVRLAISRGDAELLCDDVAEVVNDSSMLIQVRSELVDTVAVVVDGAPPLEVIIRAECRLAQ